FTANEQLANDVSELFNALTGYAKQPFYNTLIVSPNHTRKKIIGMIERETDWQRREGNGRIIMKMNALVDVKSIRALYKASNEGVSIDLVVRGICCLKPGIPGVSENIRVISIIGRFLEHSRIYYFHNGGREEIYLGSADLMPRNLDDRVEALFPVIDEKLVQEVKSDLELIMNDNVKSREMKPDGVYVKINNEGASINSQSCFLVRKGMSKKQIKSRKRKS
ncbi:MAG: RNA degradosome polyphosphate kinase, partial [Chlorobiaceae bacterium]|nr:RNA degradosome polyphosphate kinase [Chlorobiaceae bacterium]